MKENEWRKLECETKLKGRNKWKKTKIDKYNETKKK